MGFLSDYAAAKAIEVDMRPVLGGTVRDAERRAMEEAGRRIEEVCKKARSQGVGFRVWRSHYEIVRNEETLNYELRCQIQILQPGETAPASGEIYGPWPSPDDDSAIALRAAMTAQPPADDPAFDQAMEAYADDGQAEAMRLAQALRVAEDRRDALIDELSKIAKEIRSIRQEIGNG